MPDLPLDARAEIKLLRDALHASHEQGSHMHQVFGGWEECPPCEKANDECDGTLACDAYKGWQKETEAGYRSRAEMAVDRLNAELTELRTKLEIAERQNRELDRALSDTIKERDFADDMADKLAYAVAPIEVIGEHSSANCPWQNALDLITPVAEVDRLRKENAELEAGLGLNEAA
ncbi:hypothetical protein [Streptomyces goshikiensis]|uniref:hypothetical protein n=1 Tax=Streptomyces goshikiensis TaxID=1942 RepID=UPI0037109F70